MKLTRAFLIDIRARSLRKRIWFRQLKSTERSLMNLAIRVVDEVRSSRLGGLLGTIVRRLEEALGSRFLRRARERGHELADRSARIAYSWGNIDALSWASDKRYILYLGVSSMNAPNKCAL